MPKLTIGRLYTGKREVHMDSRSGAFSESLPPIEGTALRLQAALIESKPPAVSGFGLTLVARKYRRPVSRTELDTVLSSHLMPLATVEELDEVCA